MNRSLRLFPPLAGIVSLLLATAILAQEDYSPYVEREFPDRLLWGDTHLHTKYSVDAGMFGTSLGPDEAYRFARGEVITSSTGQRVRLIRSLDFLVIADHAENLGLPVLLAERNEALLATEFGRKLADLQAAGDPLAAYLAWGEQQTTGVDPIGRPDIVLSMWQRALAVAAQHNEPGEFTALLGYEWTSVPEANNLHRVVIFGDDEDKAGQVLPFSNFDSADPEDLWTWMADYEKRLDGNILAIPHNGNLSNGLMFATETFSGEPIDRAYAESRMRWEPVYEVTQIKGDGEAHPLLSPTDEFADYETWDKGNFGTFGKKPDMLQYEYARSALRLGLEQSERLGANPFKFGMIGSTDAHTGLATSREENSFGKIAVTEPGTEMRITGALTGAAPSKDGSDVLIMHWQSAASGLAAVWSTENTREAIFAAIKRKEVYATTGTRIRVRMFAGFDFTSADAEKNDLAAVGYGKGVPMGGDLGWAPDGGSVSLLIQALRDPDGAMLDRVQVIKGWLDADGKSHEKIYDALVSDRGRVATDGEVAPVGNTVDLETVTYSNSIGASVLTGVWRDPDFDPAQKAFYYVRVIEIPTPRWTAYDRLRLGTAIQEGDTQITQERAYTSPVWYSP